MTLAAFGTFEATIERAARATDEYGRDVPDWDDVQAIDATCWLQTPGGTETMEDRDEQRFDATAWFPPGTDLTGRDRVHIDGHTYEVIGPPARRHLPWSQVEHHVRASLRRVGGPGG